MGGDDEKKQQQSAEEFELPSKIKITLPAVPCSIPFECHPNFSYHAEIVNEWAMNASGVFSAEAKLKFVQSRLAWVGSMMIPRGTDDGRMILAGKNVVGVFMFDDLLESCSAEEGSDLVEKVLGEQPVLESDHYPPHFHVMKDALSLLRKGMPPSLYSRYVICLRKLFAAVREEVSYTQSGSLPDMAKYQAIRIQTAFMDGAAVMGEFCMGLELQPEDYESAELIALVSTLGNHIGLTNDLISFRKEYYSKSYFNWVFVLVHRGNMSFQEAIDKVCEMVQDTEKEIIHLQTKIIHRAAAEENQQLLDFVNAIPLAASGHRRWCYVTGRYHGFNNPLLGGDGTMSFHPDITIVEPLNYV